MDIYPGVFGYRMPHFIDCRTNGTGLSFNPATPQLPYNSRTFGEWGQFKRDLVLFPGTTNLMVCNSLRAKLQLALGSWIFVNEGSKTSLAGF